MRFVEGRLGHLLSRLFVCLVLTTVVTTIVLATPTVAQAQEGEDAPKAHASVNPVVHFFVSIGIVFGIVFLGISIGMVALIIILIMDLRMSEAVSPNFVDEFTGMVNKRQFKQAYELAKNDQSFMARVLSSGMSRLQYGIEDAREAMAASCETIRSSKEGLISYLATVGTLGPLLGLVGTVSGMVGAFRKLGESSKAPDASALAGEISHALVVTLVGVAISCPAIFFYSFFKNRLTGITHNVSTLADDLLTQMYHNSKKPGAAGGATTGGGAAATQQAVTAAQRG
jgi:biopolymer transport protein ExbB